MMDHGALADLVTRTLEQQAAEATVTPAPQAERRFWDERARRSRHRRALVSRPLAAALVAGLVATAWWVRDRAHEPELLEPAAPIRPVTVRALPSSIAEATAHMIGNGTAVGTDVWFVLGDKLVTADADGSRRSQVSLSRGTDGEAMCCLRRVGDVVLVPTAAGYSHREASTGEVLTSTPSAVAGSVAASGRHAWLRTEGDQLSLVEPRTGRVLRRVTTPGPADLVAVSGGQLVVASSQASTFALLDPVSGRVERTIRASSPPAALEAVGARIFMADAHGLLTLMDGRSGTTTRQWRVSSASVGPRPRLTVAAGSLWWSPDAGTVVRLAPSTGEVLDAVGVNLPRRWDNGDQQRNGLYVTRRGLWVPTRNDNDDYEYHRLPLTLGRP